MEAPPPIPVPLVPAEPRMTFFARALNVFAIPTAVFEDVRSSRHSFASWAGPILFAAIAMAAALWLSLCQPAVLEDFRDKQEKNIAKLQTEGKIKAVEADANRKLLKWVTQPPVARGISVAVATVSSVVKVFWWALVVWLVARVFYKVRFGYGKALEVSGLATMISVLGTVVAIVLSVGFGPVSDPAAMAKADSNTQSPIFILVANVFNIWFVALPAAGLARLIGGRFGQALFPIMGTWLAVQMILGLVAMAVGAVAR